MTEPISPKDIVETKKLVIPDSVIEVFNLEIARNFNNGKSKVLQDSVLVILMQRGIIRRRQEAFDKGWMDVEDMYRAKGWKVEYDKPAYNENYEAFFLFSIGENT